MPCGLCDKVLSALMGLSQGCVDGDGARYRLLTAADLLAYECVSKK